MPRFPTQSRSRSAPSARVCDLLAGTPARRPLCCGGPLHVTVLWDLSYILENATRISLGQIPYRDFPFPYAPLTFLLQAIIIRLCGRVVLQHYLYASLRRVGYAGYVAHTAPPSAR